MCAGHEPPCAPAPSPFSALHGPASSSTPRPTGCRPGTANEASLRRGRGPVTGGPHHGAGGRVSDRPPRHRQRELRCTCVSARAPCARSRSPAPPAGSGERVHNLNGLGMLGKDGQLLAPPPPHHGVGRECGPGWGGENSHPPPPRWRTYSTASPRTRRCRATAGDTPAPQDCV